jgi:hypothetical protein
MKVDRLIRKVMPRRNPARQNRLLISDRQTKPPSRVRFQLLLHRNRTLLKERTVTRALLGAAHTAERCLASHSTKGYSLKRCLSIDRFRTPA